MLSSASMKTRWVYINSSPFCLSFAIYLPLLHRSFTVLLLSSLSSLIQRALSFPSPLLLILILILSFFSISTTSAPAITENNSLSSPHYHSSYIFTSSPPSSLPPHHHQPASTPGCVPCLHHPRHRPDYPPRCTRHIQIRAPRPAEVRVFVCAGCTVLHKRRMLMRPTDAERCGEWTNFRSARPRFITAHKPSRSAA